MVYRPNAARVFTDTNVRMRIDGAAQAAQQAMAASKPSDAARLNYQARVLRRALESQKDQSTELLKLLEPKGRVVDIKA
jgi:hypothetical protein